MRNFLRLLFWGMLGLVVKVAWPQLPVDFFSIAVASAVLSEGLWPSLSLALVLGMGYAAFSSLPGWQVLLPSLVSIPLFFGLRKYPQWGPGLWRCAAIFYFALVNQVGNALVLSPHFTIHFSGRSVLIEVGATLFFGACLLPWWLRRIGDPLRSLWSLGGRPRELEVLQARYGKSVRLTPERGPFGWQKGL